MFDPKRLAFGPNPHSIWMVGMGLLPPIEKEATMFEHDDIRGAYRRAKAHLSTSDARRSTSKARLSSSDDEQSSSDAHLAENDERRSSNRPTEDRPIGGLPMAEYAASKTLIAMLEDMPNYSR